MIKLTGEPKVVKTDGRITEKVAMFRGWHLAISEVVAARQQEDQCPQLPHGHTVTEEYRVRVLYTVDADVFVDVHGVDVNFGLTVSRRWSCFLDVRSRRERTRVHGRRKFFFLEPDDVTDLSDMLFASELRLPVRHLEVASPDLFEKFRGEPIEDTEELRRTIPVDVDDEPEPLPDQE